MFLPNIVNYTSFLSDQMNLLIKNYTIFRSNVFNPDGSGHHSWLPGPQQDTSSFTLSTISSSKPSKSSLWHDKDNVCLTLSLFQNVWAVPDNFLLRLHGSVQLQSGNPLWHCGLRRDEVMTGNFVSALSEYLSNSFQHFCAKNLRNCENRLEGEKMDRSGV